MAIIRLTRFADAPGGVLLAFSCADSDQFYAVVEALRALGRCDAQWEPAEAAWWVSHSALYTLCARHPALGDAIRSYPAGGRSGAGSSGAGNAGSGKASGAGSRRAGGSSASGGRGGRDGGRAGGNASGNPAGKRAGNPAGVPAQVAGALAALYVRDDAPVEVVKAAHRALAKALHPDHGGDTDVMKGINVAAEIALAWAATHGARLPSGA